MLLLLLLLLSLGLPVPLGFMCPGGMSLLLVSTPAVQLPVVELSLLPLSIVSVCCAWAGEGAGVFGSAY